MSDNSTVAAPRWSDLPAADRRRAGQILGPGIQKALAVIAERRRAEAESTHARAA